MTRGAIALRAVGITGGVVATTLFVIAIAVSLALGWNLSDGFDSYSLSNSLIGASLAVCGTGLALARPRHPLGWLLLGSGIAYLLSGAATPTSVYAAVTAPVLAGVGDTLGMAAWPFAIGLGIPFVLLLFPDGRLVTRLDRLFAALVAVVGIAFVVAFATYPAPGNLLGIPGWDSLMPLWNTVQALSGLLSFGLIVRLLVRGARADDRVRRQVQWLALAALLALVVSAPLTLFGLGDNVMLLVYVLIPTAILVAVLRYQLLDITLVFSRALAWTLLTSAVVLAYIGLVAVLGTFLQTLASATIVALIVALAFDPLRRAVQRLVDRLLYGRRSEPVHVLRLVTRGASEGSEVEALLQRLAQSLRLPWLSLQADGVEAVTIGRRPSSVEELRLVLGVAEVGRLVVGVRSGQAGLARADREVLDAIAPVLALLARTVRLADDLAASRRRIVDAQESERLRVQRDLHDGVASAITGLSFRLEATKGRSDVGELQEAMAAIRTDVDGVLAAIRAVINDLRPPELDSVGLVAALRRRTAALGDPAPRVDVVVAGDLPELPASVETAAYRIGTEAVANALRHSGGSHIVLRLEQQDEHLLLTVRDDGVGMPAVPVPGVGLTSMRERAEVLGGSLVVSAADAGGADVRAVLPLGAP